MTLARAFYWIVVAATASVFAVMALWATPRIEAGAGGLALFDARFSYGFEEAEAFIGALTSEAQALYMIELRLLDTLFPLLLAIALGGGILHLTRGRAALLRGAALAPALLGAAFDLAENAAVAEMFREAVHGLSPETVAEASFWTSLKWIADVSAGAILAALLLRRAAGRRSAS